MLSLLTRTYWNSFVLLHSLKEATLPYRPLAEIEELQARRVRQMVHHAYEQVPFYRRTMMELGAHPSDFQSAADLARLPILDSSHLRAEPGQFQARRPVPTKSLTLHSSGTSGHPKSISYDHAALFTSMAHGHRQRLAIRSFTGRTYGYREMIVTRSGGVVDQLRHFYEARMWVPSSLDLRRRSLDPGGAHVRDQVAEICAFRPDVIRGYGSYLGYLFRYADEHSLSFPRPRVIVYAADGMPDPDKNLIETRFGVPVLSNYQAVEALRLAFQCEEGRGFHVCIDDVAHRVVNDKGLEVAAGEEGDLIVSNLTNRSTVLLNYRLGDRVTAGSSGCPCGRTLPCIGRVRGRSDDLITLSDGRVIHSSPLLISLQRVAGVHQTQIVQETVTRFLIRAVLAPTASRSRVREALIEALKTQFKGSPVAVRVEFSPVLARQASGKVKAVISELPAAE